MYCAVVSKHTYTFASQEATSCLLAQPLCWHCLGRVSSNIRALLADTALCISAMWLTELSLEVSVRLRNGGGDDGGGAAVAVAAAAAAGD
jgi:hypothetical protein